MPAGISNNTMSESPIELPPGSGIRSKSPHKNFVILSMTVTIGFIPFSPYFAIAFSL